MENFISFCTYIPLKISAAFLISLLLTYLTARLRKTHEIAANRILVLIPIVLFGFAILTLVCNVPFWDDYDAILRYLSREPTERINALFSFHNEHRIAFPRICFELIRALFGTFNFTYCIIFGDLILLTYVFVLGKRLVRSAPIICFLPFVWLFLDLANFENTLWALTAIQSHFVLLFSLLACIYIGKRENTSRNLALTILFAVLATYTSGSGMGIWPILIFFSIKKTFSPNAVMRSVLSARNLILLSAAAVTMGCYLIGFSENSATLQAENPAVKTTLAVALVNRADFILSFLGAIVPFHAIALPIGVISAGLITFIFINHRKLNDDTTFAYLCYLLTIVGSGALFRGSTCGGAAVALRYGIVSFSILACVTVFVFKIISNHYPQLTRAINVFLKLLTFGCILINLSVLLLGHQLLNIRKGNLLDGISKRASTCEGLQYPVKERGALILDTAIQKGVYTPPN